MGQMGMQGYDMSSMNQMYMNQPMMMMYGVSGYGMDYSGSGSGTGTGSSNHGVSSSGQTFTAGDWNCSKCGDHQFARNMSCRKCGAPKIPGLEGSEPSYGGK